MKNTILLGLALAFTAGATPLYTISITSPGDSFQVITPAVQAPTAKDEYAPDAFQKNNVLHFWEEQLGVLVPSDISVHTGFGVRDYLSNGFTNIPGNTRVNSYYAHFDPANLRFISGSITFDPSVQLIAVLVRTRTLDATDSLFIHPNGVAPGAFNSRGFELLNRLTSSVSGNTFNFFLTASSPGDQFRFITTVPDQGGQVPEPGTYALVGSALAGLAWLRRRK
jgi:hypothetical protein